MATVKTYQPEGDIKSYAVKMFGNHGKGIGVKGKDNGVLLLLALDDREVWIESGYGLEGFVTDGFAGESSRAMVPFFRTGEYGRGLVAGATRVAHASGKAARDPIWRRRRKRQPSANTGDSPGLCIILLSFSSRSAGAASGVSVVSGVGPFGGCFRRGFGAAGSAGIRRRGWRVRRWPVRRRRWWSELVTDLIER